MSTHNGPLQYCLFGLQAEDQLAKLHEKEAKLRRLIDAPNTLRAYDGGWKIFSNWCRDWRFCKDLPASPDHVREFLTWATQLRTPAYKTATVQLALAAIKRAHREAGYSEPVDKAVREVIRGIVRQAARSGARPENAGKKHLSVEQLKKLCLSLGSEPIDIRDRALILVGFASALRRSDLSRLQTWQVHFEGKGLRLWIPFSKTDQKGTGRELFLEAARDPALCPKKAIEEWRAVRMEYCGHFSGPVFVAFNSQFEMKSEALGPEGINLALKRRLRRTGENAVEYGAHSMRSGMITSAHEAGANLRAIMDRSGHKSVETVMRYIKSSNLNPLANVL